MSESAQPREVAHPAPLKPDPLQGTPYRTIGALGRGGMGEVVEAEHVELQRRVVVKLLHQQLATDPKLVDRMRVEARTLAALAHPNVVAVTDFGWTPGKRAYFVMERLYGRTLRAELAARGPLSVDEAIGYVRQVLAGLGAAHRLGIVHRDVKADNIFLCERVGIEPAIVKVLDFGIAKVLRGEGPARGPTPQYPTQEGVLLGTPRTVAPEQALCQPVDARADIYGVGVLLYTLVTGTGPFPDARGQAELLTAHVSETPKPPSAWAKQPIPPELDRAILKALAKRRDDRFQTADEFSEELGRISTRIACATGPLPSTTEAQPKPEQQAPESALTLGSSSRGAPPPAEEVDEPTTVQPPKALWAAPLPPVPEFAQRAGGAMDKPAHEGGAARARARPGSRAWLFFVVLVASTAFFSGVLALVAHVWRAPR